MSKIATILFKLYMMLIHRPVIEVAVLLLGGAEALQLSQSSLCTPLFTRARFLSSFVASSALLWTNAVDEACSATPDGMHENPRYIDQELQMKYGESSGACHVNFRR